MRHNPHSPKASATTRECFTNIFWVVMQCIWERARRFGRAMQETAKIRQYAGPILKLVSAYRLLLPISCVAYSSTLKMEWICSSETSGCQPATKVLRKLIFNPWGGEGFNCLGHLFDLCWECILVTSLIHSIHPEDDSYSIRRNVNEFIYFLYSVQSGSIFTPPTWDDLLSRGHSSVLYRSLRTNEIVKILIFIYRPFCVGRRRGT